ncbi:MAG: hypothetical protein ACI4SQ_00065 [Eubacterium sp.]
MKTMKKRIAAFGMIMMLAVSVLAVPVNAKPKGYVFSYKKANVYMRGPAQNLIKKAGKPQSKKVKKSCAYKGKDRTYKYKDFILYTYSNSDEGAEYVNGITFLTSKVSTKEGIHIGSPYSSVEGKYGKAKNRFGIYTYIKGKSKLQIEVTDDVVTNIRYIISK